MPGKIHCYLAADHDRLDALLERAISDPTKIDAAAYAQFRAGLLKHIALEEKVLLPAAQKARGRYQLGNASACLAALDVMRASLPVSANDIRSGLLKTENPGRFQVLPGRPVVVLDVSHNPHSAAALASTLTSDVS